MNRFQKQHHLIQKFPAVLFFCSIIGLFLAGLNSVSRMTSGNEQETLKRSILQSAVHCYATEGFYPDSISYLEEHYGIRYDHSRYVISYEAIGSNMMPDVSVIPLNGKKGDSP